MKTEYLTVRITQRMREILHRHSEQKQMHVAELVRHILESTYTQGANHV